MENKVNKPPPFTFKKTNKATFVILRHPGTILVTDFTNPDNLTNDLLILNSSIIKNKSLVSPLEILYIANKNYDIGKPVAQNF